MKTLTKFYLMLRDRKGATMAEYAVVVVLLILIALVTLTPLGSAIAAAFTRLIAPLGTGA